MRTFPALVIAATIGFAHLAIAADGFVGPNLTGTWSGKLVCKGLGSTPPVFGKFTFAAKEATLEITQTDNLLAAALTANDPEIGMLPHDPWCGGVVANPDKPDTARAGLVLSLTEPGAALAVEFQSAKVFPVNGKGVTGKLRGKGVFFGSGGGGGSSASCKWAFDRTSETPPAEPVSGCPSSGPA
jgi:hypothetical protein